MTTIPSKTVERLQELYEGGGAFAKVCEDLAGRDRAYREWPVKRMCQRTGLARSEVVRVFKQFEELELGRFVVGRGGNQSRFVSDVSMVNAARLAVGEDVEEASEEFAEESEPEGIEHTFWLGPDFPVGVTLAADLTKDEAERLANSVRALPFS